MNKLYSIKPKSDNKELERSTWSLVEDYEAGKRIIIILLISLLVTVFVLHLHTLLALLVTTIICAFSVLVIKKAHKEAFERYWSYWQKNKDK